MAAVTSTAIRYASGFTNLTLKPRIEAKFTFNGAFFANWARFINVCIVKESMTTNTSCQRVRFFVDIITHFYFLKI